MAYSIVFFILALCCTANAGAFSRFPNLPNLDDPVSAIKNVAEGGTIGAIGVISSTPELVTDTFGNILDLKKVPTVPRVPVPDLIAKEGYQSETHHVTTEDGYILTIHRIPCGKKGQSNGKVVLLQHGLLAASSDWVLLGAENGLGYILADEGYDVWMPNVRGNTYSRKHERFTPEQEQFWEFSWHEIGIYDIPSCIDYILMNTGKSQLLHLGHSQGTTTFYVMTTKRPEYNAKITAHISLAPIAYMQHLFSPLIRLLAPGTFPIEILLKLIGEYEFLPSSGFLNFATDVICSEGVGKVLCKNALFAMAGFSPKQMNVSNIPLVMAHYPAGAATRQVVHYGQEVNSGKFQQFDFGLLKNLEKYNDNQPPEYELHKISTPTHLIYGSNDWLAANMDVQKLYSELRCPKEIYNIPIQTWNHLDFIFGKDAKKEVYTKVIQIFSKY